MKALPWTPAREGREAMAPIRFSYMVQRVQRGLIVLFFGLFCYFLGFLLLFSLFPLASLEIFLPTTLGFITKISKFIVQKTQTYFSR